MYPRRHMTYHRSGTEVRIADDSSQHGFKSATIGIPCRSEVVFIIVSGTASLRTEVSAMMRIHVEPQTPTPM